ncbi:XRE family transcriptional regulator [Proteus hauseri]|uniref:XRE family transcriptional regulator n=1 Tax=Proteus hauseri TaxID=183417 RepID=UPI0032DB4F51
MSLNKVLKIVDDLSDEEKNILLSKLNTNQNLNNNFNIIQHHEKSLNLFILKENELKKLITFELKKQGITYEEMAMQIDVSIATFKRIIANPLMAKTINLHSLLKELGFKLCLEK